MDNTIFKTYKIEDKSFVSFIKRDIHHHVAPHFSSTRTGEIDIVVAELCSNVVKYANGGELLYRLSTENGSPLFELLCIDSGPGIRNLVHYMKDGMTSSTSLGHGIGSVTRLSNMAQFYTLDDWGTIVYCRFKPDADAHEPRVKLQLRHLVVAKPGENYAGDGISVKTVDGRVVILTGDGLGHGVNAYEAAQEAINCFEQSSSDDPMSLIKEIDKAVRKTRGLVATVAVFDDHNKNWEICGVGNISTKLYHGLEYRNYVCNNGIIGMNMPGRIDNAFLKAEKFQQLIMCSDGIRTKWDIIKYPSILKYDPMLLAAAIYKDHARRTDDMTILIAKVL